MNDDLTAIAEAVGVYVPQRRDYTMAFALGVLAILIIFLGAK